mmetsp:Transcript_2718/g.8733  ORF Transcript_2718/g.8733 Transcript_2718/m.8733 type:complete len:253 (-) Transcript_2718:913-1671(-)
MPTQPNLRQRHRQQAARRGQPRTSVAASSAKADRKRRPASLCATRVAPVRPSRLQCASSASLIATMATRLRCPWSRWTGRTDVAASAKNACGAFVRRLIAWSLAHRTPRTWSTATVTRTTLTGRRRSLSVCRRCAGRRCARWCRESLRRRPRGPRANAAPEATAGPPSTQCRSRCRCAPCQLLTLPSPQRRLTHRRHQLPQTTKVRQSHRCRATLPTQAAHVSGRCTVVAQPCQPWGQLRCSTTTSRRATMS